MLDAGDKMACRNEVACVQSKACLVKRPLRDDDHMSWSE